MKEMLNKEHTKDKILQTLQYFHIFKHPLYFDEIHKFLTIKSGKADLSASLEELVSAGAVFAINDMYLLKDDYQYTLKRLKGKERADLIMPAAIKSASVISKFPFVSSICISGSLSKGYANEKSDIDLFIISEKNRLWICRTILHLYKKLTFLWGNEHSYCMNYFIDESRLCLEEHNIFTATELATLIPVYNKAKFDELIKENKKWLTNILPNTNWDNTGLGNDIAEKKGFRRVVEPVLNFALPKYINILLMRLTDNWWRFKWRRKNYPMADYDLAMKTRWYVSKNHPLNYQKKVLKEIEPTFYSKVASIIP